MAIAAGTRFGPYEILAPLGAGGMGEVYRARDTRIGREVAVKVLPTGFATDPDRLRRFEQEARAAGALNHPNILVLHDVGTQDGIPYLVTELLEGETLRDRLDHGALTPRKAIDMALQIARGLAAAHERGLVHRDLKPGNLFVLRDGRVKILDFGLAKLTRPEPDGQATVPTATVDTDKSVVMGTAGYMAPEQVRGQPADHRADIFSFGAILYEMLSGRRAFQGGTSAETMTAILREEPPDISSDGRSLPPALERIVRHCLEKSPQERFQSASDVAFALEALSGVSDSGPKAALGSPRRRWAPFVAPALLCLALLAAGWLAGLKFAAPRHGEAPLDFRKLTFRRGVIYVARFSDNGQRVYYSASWDGDSVCTYSCDLGTPASSIVGLPPEAFFLSLSRSNEMAVLLHSRLRPHSAARGTLARLTSGGAPREILDDVADADWSPDGASLAVAHIVADRYRLEYPIGTVLHESPGWISHVRVSPDGRRVAFLEHPVYPDDRGVLMVVSAGTAARALTPTYSSVQGVAWSPRGNQILFAGASRGAARSIRAVDLDGHVHMLASLPNGGRIHDIAPDGAALVTSDNVTVGFRARGPGQDEKDLGWLDWSLPVAISPDGRSVLFDEEGNGGGDHYSVYLRRMDGSPPIRLGEGGALDLSPDGKWAMSIRLWEQPPELVLLPTGVGEPRPLPPSGLENIVAAKFLPSGKDLLIVGNEGGHGARAYLRALEGGPMRPVTPEGVLVQKGLVSPDGRWVLGTEGQTARLYSVEGREVRDVVGKSPEESILGWSSDGRSLYVVSRGIAPILDVSRLEIATGRRTPWTRMTGPEDRAGISLANAVVGHDDFSYAYLYGRALSDLFLVHGLPAP
jgi:Tol biopolymer transport system component